MRRAIIGAVGAVLLSGAFHTEALAVSPPVISGESIAGPSLAAEVRARKTVRHHRRAVHRRHVYNRRHSRAGAAIAAGTVLGLVGSLAAAAATPSYTYGDPYWYDDGPYGNVAYGYGYPAYSYPAYRAYPVYGYAYPYRRAYYPRTPYHHGYYGHRNFDRHRFGYGRPAFIPSGVTGGRVVPRGFGPGGVQGRPVAAVPIRPGGFAAGAPRVPTGFRR